MLHIGEQKKNVKDAQAKSIRLKVADLSVVSCMEAQGHRLVCRVMYGASTFSLVDQ